MCDVIIVSTISQMLHTVATVVMIILYALSDRKHMLVLSLKAAKSFLEITQ